MRQGARRHLAKFFTAKGDPSEFSQTRKNFPFAKRRPAAATRQPRRQMQTLELSETTPGRYSASIGDEVIVNSRHPTAAACAVLAGSGVSGMIRVGWRDGAPFTCDVARTAAWSPSPAAQGASRPWSAPSNLDSI
jgi:hypothetical protein